MHGIQHIDCYAKLLDEETILVKQVPPSHPEHECVERLANQLASQPSCYGRPYQIVRIECPDYANDQSAAYTNSLILNRKVLVPLFNIPGDAVALAVYAEAMPGYEVIGVNYGAWYYYDALHCRTMGMFDPHMLRITHRRLEPEQAQQAEYEILATIDDRSEAGLLAGDLRLYWQVLGAPAWDSVPLEGVTGDLYRAAIPWQPVGTEIAYYLSAADASGRHETLPRTAPGGSYRFAVIDNPAGIPIPFPAAATPPSLALHPTIGTGEVRLDLSLPRAGSLAVDVFDLGGRRLATLVRGDHDAGGLGVRWDGTDDHGTPCPGGVYLIRACTPWGTAQARFLRLR